MIGDDNQRLGDQKLLVTNFAIIEKFPLPQVLW
jgi:hypothetical protein